MPPPFLRLERAAAVLLSGMGAMGAAGIIMAASGLSKLVSQSSSMLFELVLIAFSRYYASVGGERAHRGRGRTGERWRQAGTLG